MARYRSGSHGLTHCGIFIAWSDLDKAVRSDGEGGLVWQWLCNLCGDVIRSESFAFPDDFPTKGQGRVGSEA